MATTKVKNLKKTDWQKIASEHGIIWLQESPVRYLVEKVAEKIGVDDKIVKLDDLKQAVCDKLNMFLENNSENVDNSVTISISEDNETSIKSNIEVKNDENVILSDNIEVISENINVISENNVIDKLSELRKECENLGIAYSEKHTETDLQQIVNAVKSVSSGSFELNTANANAISNIAPSQTIPATNNNPVQAPVISHFPVQQTPSHLINHSQGMNLNVGIKELEGYRDIFVGTIRGFWRKNTYNEVVEMLNRDTYPFSHVIGRNKDNNNLIEIHFTNGANKVRLPSEDKYDWLEING
jgi:hypothetical protein